MPKKTKDEKKQAKSKSKQSKAKADDGLLTSKQVRSSNKQAGVATTRTLLKQTFSLVWSNKKIFLTLTILYGIFHFVLVQGPVDVSINEAKTTLSDILPNQRNNNLLLAGVVVGESASVNEAAAVYQFFLVLIFALASIWIARMLYEGQKVRARDGFYKGMYGIVPVLMVFIVMLFQILPAALGGLIYSVASINGIITSHIETAIFAVLFALLASVSLYFLTSSLIALFIAALPDVPPMEALSTSAEVVRGRRAKIFMRLLLGGLFFSLAGGLVLLAFIATLPGLAVWVWWVISIFAVPVSTVYLYNLYRSLL